MMPHRQAKRTPERGGQPSIGLHWRAGANSAANTRVTAPISKAVVP
jgi:hypothetical protein